LFCRVRANTLANGEASSLCRKAVVVKSPGMKHSLIRRGRFLEETLLRMGFQLNSPPSLAKHHAWEMLHLGNHLCLSISVQKTMEKIQTEVA